MVWGLKEGNAIEQQVKPTVSWHLEVVKGFRAASLATGMCPPLRGEGRESVALQPSDVQMCPGFLMWTILDGIVLGPLACSRERSMLRAQACCAESYK